MSSLSSTMSTRHAMATSIRRTLRMLPAPLRGQMSRFGVCDHGRMAARRLVLASRSETRLRILRQAGFDPVVAPSDVDETVGDLEPSVAVSELALRKASAVAPEHPDDLV